MIDSMKKLDSEIIENTEPESVSSGFEALFLEHWARVYRLLYRLVGDPAEAEDLALETFVRLHQRYPPRDDEFNLGGWLHRVATNLGLQSIRSWKRRERYEMTAGKYALEDVPEAQPAPAPDHTDGCSSPGLPASIHGHGLPPGEDRRT